MNEAVLNRMADALDRLSSTLDRIENIVLALVPQMPISQQEIERRMAEARKQPGGGVTVLDEEELPNIPPNAAREQMGFPRLPKERPLHEKTAMEATPEELREEFSPVRPQINPEPPYEPIIALQVPVYLSTDKKLIGYANIRGNSVDMVIRSRDLTDNIENLNLLNQIRFLGLSVAYAAPVEEDTNHIHRGSE